MSICESVRVFSRTPTCLMGVVYCNINETIFRIIFFTITYSRGVTYMLYSSSFVCSHVRYPQEETVNRLSFNKELNDCGPCKNENYEPTDGVPCERRFIDVSVSTQIHSNTNLVSAFSDCL